MKITLADEQHMQMCGMVNAIDSEAIDDLQKIFKERESHGVGTVASSRRSGQQTEDKG